MPFSLDLLGRHPVTGRHVFLRARLEPEEDDQEPQPLPAHVQYVDASQGGWTDGALRAALDGLSALQQLDASHNALESCLGGFFTPRLCSEAEGAWPAGEEAVGSVLRVADLSHNRICALPSAQALSWHRFLRDLSLDHNQLASCDGLSGLRCLERLSLAHNDLRRLTDLDGLPLRELNVSHNRLDACTGLDQLPRLTHVDLGANRVADLAPLAACASLASVVLNDNPVASTAGLDGLQLLTHLVLRGTPLAAREFYRQRVVVRLQTLVELDGATVSAEEKVKSQNLFGADLDNRRQVLERHLPGHEFVNHLPIAPAGDLLDLDQPESPPRRVVQDVEDAARVIVGGVLQEAQGGVVRKELSSSFVDGVIQEGLSLSSPVGGGGGAAATWR